MALANQKRTSRYTGMLENVFKPIPAPASVRSGQSTLTEGQCLRLANSSAAGKLASRFMHASAHASAHAAS